MPPITATVRPGVLLDARRALLLNDVAPAVGPLLVVADLHWGYAESHRRTGNLLPIWGDDQLAATLHGLIADHRPSEMLWLGDSLHTTRGRTAAEAFLHGCPVPVTILAGNHDRRWSFATDHILTRGNWLFHHGDLPPPKCSGTAEPFRRPDPTSSSPARSGTAEPFRPHPSPAEPTTEVIGHHHPAFVWHDGAGGRVKIPAAVIGPRKIILPALSPWAAGVAWNARLAAEETLWVVAPRRIFPVRPVPNRPYLPP